MKIAILQLDTAWMNPKANCSTIDSICKLLSKDVEILCLPEMFSTGFSMDTNNFSPQWQWETLDSIQSIASKYNIQINGSIAWLENNQFFNRFIWVNQFGLQATYDKIHLFSPAKENNYYSPGTTSTQIIYKDVGVTPFICYDLRFPYLPWQIDKKDIIIYSANWPKARIEHWKTLLQARAIENQCFVIGINRVGTDPNGYEYNGQSAIFDPTGKLLTEYKDNQCLIECNIELNILSQYQLKLPFYKDRKLNNIFTTNIISIS